MKIQIEAEPQSTVRNIRTDSLTLASLKRSKDPRSIPSVTNGGPIVYIVREHDNDI